MTQAGAPAILVFDLLNRHMGSPKTIGFSNTLISTPLIKKSLFFAYKAHKNQKRHSGENYITHPLEVARILMRADIDDEEIIAASLLHDVLEKTNIDTFRLEREFGKNISNLVNGVTKLKKIHYNGNMHLRQSESIKKLFLTMSQDPRVMLVKLADRLHNMRTLEYVSDQKKKKIAMETFEIYSPAANMLGLREWAWELEDLSFKFLYPEKYEKISKDLGGVLKKISKCVRLIKKNLLKCAKGKIIFKIKSFRKHNCHIYRMQQKKGQEFNAIRDACAIKIITNTADNCYKLLGFIHSFFPPQSASIKDFIAIPKTNGYMGLHTVVFGSEGKMLHIQIQTESMWKRPINFNICKMQKEAFIKNILSIHKRAKNPGDFIRQMKLDMLGKKISVFSPKGKIIDLPENSTCVDFAYAVHPAIGNRLKEAIVNGVRMQPHAKLKTGDIVETVTNKRISGPCIEWMEKVKTIRARHYISKWHTLASRDLAVKAGMEKMDKALRVFLNTTMERSKKEICQRIKKGKAYANTDELFETVGRGKEKPDEALIKIYPEKHLLRSEAQKNLSASALKEMRAKPIKLTIKTDNAIGMLSKLTQCISVKNINIEKNTAQTYEEAKSAICEFIVAVENFKQLSELIADLEQIQGVRDICKV